MYLSINLKRIKKQQLTSIASLFLMIFLWCYDKRASQSCRAWWTCDQLFSSSWASMLKFRSLKKNNTTLEVRLLGDTFFLLLHHYGIRYGENPVLMLCFGEDRRIQHFRRCRKWAKKLLKCFTAEFIQSQSVLMREFWHFHENFLYRIC